MTDARARLEAAVAQMYTIERELGRGGAAIVYLAHDRKHDREVALKVLRPEVAATLGTDRFLREIRTAARLQHPHIVPLHDSGEAAGFLYYVMPYFDGESLRTRLERTPQLGLDEAVRIARQIADALTYAHGQGVVHRDIKPENVLFSTGDSGSGHALVADFGIAKALTEAGSGSLTETGLALGTPAYMSPEQAAGERAIDGRADVYALGCVLYEMLAGHPPFLGRSAQEVRARHSLDQVPPLRSARPDLPESVERAILKSLAKSPADRYDTTSGFTEAVATAVAQEPSSASRAKAVAAIAAVGVGLALVGYGIVSRWPGRQESAADSSPSIAVLAFVNVGGDPTNEPFSDGMADELTTALGKVEGLGVAARTSAFRFKGKSLAATEIGRQLGVGYILGGSVRRAEDRRRVSAELIDVATGKELWADNFDHDARDQDVFGVQDSIVRAIMRELRLKLAGGPGLSAIRRSTGSPEAHDLYLQGRYFFARRDPASLDKARDYFIRAIELDSSYALAYAGLSEAYSHSSVFGRYPPREVFPKAKAAVRRALELDSTLVEAQTSLGFIAVFYDWDWPTARRAFERALALDSRYAPAHLFNAWYLVATDQMDAALEEFRAAVKLDPFSTINNARLVDALFFARRYDEAILQARRLLELDPAFFQGQMVLGQIYAALGRCAEALQALEGGPEQTATSIRGLLGYAYGRCGHRAQALAELDRLAANARAGHYASHFGFAMIRAGLGETDRAFAELDSAYSERAWPMFLLRVRPEFDGLRADPRFAKLVERVGLVSRLP